LLWDGTLGDAEADRLLLLLLLTGGSSSATASADRLLLVGSKAVITVTAPCHQPLCLWVEQRVTGVSNQVALLFVFYLSCDDVQ